MSCVDISANSDGLAGRALVNSAGDNVLDSDSSLKSSHDCVIGRDGTLVDGASHGYDGSDNSLLLTSAKRAIGNAGCAGRDGDDSSAVNNCGTLGIVCLSRGSLSTTRNAGNGTLRANSLDSGGSDCAGDETGRTTAKNNGTGLNLSGDNSDSCSGLRTRIGANAKSRVRPSIDVSALDSTVVSANAG